MVGGPGGAPWHVGVLAALGRGGAALGAQWTHSGSIAAPKALSCNQATLRGCTAGLEGPCSAGSSGQGPDLVLLLPGRALGRLPCATCCC